MQDTDAHRGRLYLIPSTLGAQAPIATIPAQSLALLQRLEHFIVETPKQARRFLQQCGVQLSTRQIAFHTLDEHTPEIDVPLLLAPLLQGADVGVLSDAGCPAVADPGARLVRLAHERGLDVVPLAGPSSIILALMASGLHGQRFTFRGYLPVEPEVRALALTRLERAARDRFETQIFIETPYRNNQMLRAVLQSCARETLLCVAADLTLPTQYIRTATIARWRSEMVDLDRRPAVFLLGAPMGAGADSARSARARKPVRVSERSTSRSRRRPP